MSFVKKIAVCCLALALVIVLASSLAFGADTGELIKVYRNLVKLEVNSTPVDTDNFLYNGTTYVPIRAVAELLGKEVDWNAYTSVAGINDVKYEKELLSGLLPDQEGYTWLYHGFAEYGHQMKLDKITDERQKRIYSISGEVYDPSGGESTKDRTISLHYILEDNNLKQEKVEEAMLDSKYDSLILIKTPLVAGTSWSQKVVEKNGKETLLNTLIKRVEVASDGKKEYTVRYEDTNSNYYEERVIKEGSGVVAFEKLLELEDSSFPVSYFQYVGGNIETIELNLYFPDEDASKLFQEKREMLVVDNRKARAAIQGLIAGPRQSGLKSSIPDGTVLLNIYIQNRICYLDFSREFIDNHSGGSAGELMTLGSIVNTLTDLEPIDSVQIMVEGKTGETLGNILLDSPLERMEDLIAETE